MVYKKTCGGKWCCSWCSFTHEDYKVVIDHENNEMDKMKKE